MKPPTIVINGKTLTPEQAAVVSMVVIESLNDLYSLQPSPEETKLVEDWREPLTEVVLILRTEASS